MKLVRSFIQNSEYGFKGLDLATMKEVELVRLKQAKFRRGFYVNHNGQLIGIVATTKGPMFFCNDKQYLLKDQFKFHLLHQPRTNTFLFEWNGEIKLHVTYKRILYKKGNALVDDMVQDFYTWLVAASSRKRFYNFYTVEDEGVVNKLPELELVH